MTVAAPAALVRANVTFWNIWNMCFGFFGIQFGFQLQNSNVSRIFMTLGADPNSVSALWIAAPLTGLIVQPIIGYLSDRTWTWLGRRRPYFLAGAVLATLALFAMPRSPTLWIAAGMLWVLDASINIAMEPFRAFVADQLPESQRAAGYTMQSFFIGAGAVVAGVLPWIFDHFGVSNVGNTHSAIPDTVRYAFDAGAVVLLVAILWTVMTSREYPPTVLHGFTDATPLSEGVEPGSARNPVPRGVAWVAAGGVGAALIQHYALDKYLYILAGMTIAWGALLVVARVIPRGPLAELVGDIDNMPRRMRELIPVQFFSWLALFCMWTQSAAAVTRVHFGTTDVASAAYNKGANWVGVLFSAYSGFAALAAMVIPSLVRRLGIQKTHLVCLWLGGAGLISMRYLSNPDSLLVSMVGVGFAWASIVSMPYALLAGSVPSRKMGVYMGIFNFFIVIPQLVIGTVTKTLLEKVFDGQAIYVLVVGGVSLLLAGILALRVK